MSAETIALVISAAAVLVTLGGTFIGGIGWLVRRMDDRFDRVDERIDRVDARIDGVERELVEVKIGLARLEGPPRHLIPAR